METNEKFLDYIVVKTNPILTLFPDCAGKIANLFLAALQISHQDNFIIAILNPIKSLESKLRESTKEGSKSANSLFMLMHELRKAVFGLSQVENISEKEDIRKYFETMRAKSASLESYLCEELGVTGGVPSSNNLFLGMLNMDMAVTNNENFVLEGHIERKKFDDAVIKYFKERGGDVEIDEGWGFNYKLGDKDGAITVSYCNDVIMVSVL